MSRTKLLGMAVVVGLGAAVAAQSGLAWYVAKNTDGGLFSYMFPVWAYLLP